MDPNRHQTWGRSSLLDSEQAWRLAVIKRPRSVVVQELLVLLLHHQRARPQINPQALALALIVSLQAPLQLRHLMHPTAPRPVWQAAQVILTTMHPRALPPMRQVATMFPLHLHNPQPVMQVLRMLLRPATARVAPEVRLQLQPAA